MAIFVYDPFTFPAGNSIAGTVPSIGGTWSGNIDLGHTGDAINYDGVKLGERDTLPDSAALFFNPATPASADYSVRVPFIAGNNVNSMVSIGVALRIQQTVPDALLDFYYVAYSGITQEWILLKRNDHNGAPGPFFQTYAMVLTAGQTYILDVGIVSDTVTVSVDSTVIMTETDSSPGILTAAGHAGIRVSDCRPLFNETDGWWFGDYTAYTGTLDTTFSARGYGISGARAAMHQRGPGLNLYFSGSGTQGGEDFTPVDYGVPTLVEIDNPIAGTEYAIPVTPVDLAGFTPGKMGNVKLRRDADAPIANTTDVVFRGMSIKYKKA